MYTLSGTGWKSKLAGDGKYFKKIQKFNDFKTVDWVDDVITENKKQLTIDDKHKNINGKNVVLLKYPILGRFLFSCQSWLLLTLIGIVVGLIAASLNIITQFLADIKTGHCKEHFYLNKSFCCWGEDLEKCQAWTSWSNLSILNYFYFVAISILFGLLAAVLVKNFAPTAAGSGISEIKVIVSGFTMDGFLSWWTLLIKSLGLPLAIASGLSVGKEGPSVHYAACVGNCFPELFDRFKSSYSNTRHFLTAASAAGVAVAFGSPMGGVLFSIEEISSVFALSTMWRSYFCCLVSTGVLRAVNSFRTGQLVMFEVRYDQNWYFFEIPFFIILGIFGGIYGITISKFNIQWVSFRQRFLKNYAIREVVLLTFFSSLICYFNEFLRLDMTEGMEILFHECGSSGEEWSHHICNYDKGQLKLFISLLYATILRMFLVVISYGCKVPCGIFVPSMAAGATFGRAIGIIVLKLYEKYPDSFFFKSCEGNEHCIIPGTFAFLGAGATLSGITHLTVTVVVIMFELTGALRYIIPTMIVVAVTKIINDNFGSGGGIADKMIKFNGLPFIDNKEDHIFNLPAVRAMCDKIVVLPVNELSYSDLEAILMETDFSTFPIVESINKPILIGSIGRTELLYCIENTREQAVGDLSRESKLSENDSIEPLISFEQFVNFAPITINVNISLETTMDMFHKIGPKIIFVEDDGLLAGLITRKDIIQFEIYLEFLKNEDRNDINNNNNNNNNNNSTTTFDIENMPIRDVEQQIWNFFCVTGDFIKKNLRKITGERIGRRYLRLENDE
ncbi:hypothetical protein PACTADRAFT_40186 [Pachysolen tannophilus NRRL Y-2460]|uniref:Chloride channel protein n=1 Tax=Pachysolen tannophilus NRRL Y-2460 TaxID=669874 RepID=A0A1E4TY68_PACTA|nr:hypothetical protein PACTADRAFT_40186 [Pachysolen tannophilus NRRL Y-2460]